VPFLLAAIALNPLQELVTAELDWAPLVSPCRSQNAISRYLCMGFILQSQSRAMIVEYAAPKSNGPAAA
jgi:hypothetical protein